MPVWNPDLPTTEDFRSQLARVFELANDARLLTDPELAAHRLSALFATAGLTR